VLGKRELVEARVYATFGYDRRLPELWKRIGLDYPFQGRKAFDFPETTP